MRTPLTVHMLTGEGEALMTEPADLLNGNSLAITGPTLLSFFAVAGGNVTIRNPRYDQGGADDGLKVPDRVLSIPPATVWLWLCPPGYYDQADATINIDFGQATNVAAYQLQG